MTQPVHPAPYREGVTDTRTPVAVTTYRLVEKLFEDKRDGDTAVVTFTELRRLVTAGQRVMLEDLAARTEPEPAHLRLPKPWDLMARQGDAQRLAPEDLAALRRQWPTPHNLPTGNES